MEQRTGIIDIGSNSIRLVVYEQYEDDAYRIVDESKSSARLSAKTGSDGKLAQQDLDAVVETLAHFKRLSEAHRVTTLLAVATAAVRNAANSAEALAYLRRSSGLDIRVLSGEAEARYGFIGMINTIDVKDGFLIDIGGGSTELSLFRGRELVHSVSFPFGAVNTSKQWTLEGTADPAALEGIRRMVQGALAACPWAAGHPGLPLIGLGGTIRSIGKIDQRRRGYSLQLAHRYEIGRPTFAALLHELAPLSPVQRKKVDGIDKQRADLIVAGLAIVQAIADTLDASVCIVSGSGLRDGLFFETLRPGQPVLDDVLEHSVRNLLALHPSVPVPHVEQVKRIALRLYAGLSRQRSAAAAPLEKYLSTAALLYRIGVSVQYYQYERHTFYLMANARIDGLTHREIVLCALAASFQSSKKSRRLYMQHKDMLSEDDFLLATRLGALLRLAIALDRSETQPIAGMSAALEGGELQLALSYRHYPSIELKELADMDGEFDKTWGCKLILTATPQEEATLLPL
ncbi:Ppx/GppA phosphatase family protein [Paenibacillus cymbidii]|uniref:Ppx/GppA phosphatase family protein n=1 Tax=Paenibacillus cymbidii TaxID=1639034 RepID=UPI001F1AA4DC|nr:Ppx/GppA phosphatase family protein [Paenibacillus cymbidii]